MRIGMYIISIYPYINARINCDISRHGATTMHVVNGLYGAWIIKDKEEQYEPKMIDVVLLISFAYLHTYEKCASIVSLVGCGRNSTLRYVRPPTGGNATNPLNFPIQSACLS